MKAGPRERMITINIIYLRGYISQTKLKGDDNFMDKRIRNINKSACNINYKYLPDFIVNRIGEELQEYAN